MLQLVKLNKDIKEKRLSVAKRWLYHYENSSLTLEEEDIRIVTICDFTGLAAINADMNNNTVCFFNSAEGIAVSTVPTVMFTTNNTDRINDLEAEVNRLRTEVSRLRNGSNETTERTDPHV